MNARGFRSMSVTLLLLATSVAIMTAASVTRMQVNATRELTIAIVDPQRTTPERNQFRARVAEALKLMLVEAGADSVKVHPVYVGGRDARLKLNGGAYDAALVIGNDRPLSLRRLELLTLAGSMAAPNGLQPVSLVIGKGDAVLNDRLRAAFGRLISERPLPYAAAPANTKLATIDG